jgi:2-dehydropantoate 2-reductase
MSDDTVFAVVGPGAVGGLLAWLLHRAGHDVVAVGRPATVEAIRADGIEVRSAQFGDGVERVPADTVVPAGASVLLATKAYGLDAVLPDIAASRPVEVVSFLNGFEHVGPLRAALPGVPVAGASVAVSALRLSPTVIDHRSPFVNIEAPEAAAGFAAVRALDGAGPRVRAQGTEPEVLWAKFRMLAGLALLTSYWRQPAGSALSEDPELTEAVVAEIAACSTAEGCRRRPSTSCGYSAASRARCARPSRRTSPPVRPASSTRSAGHSCASANGTASRRPPSPASWRR